jgi:hypothetical protein
MDFGVFVAEFFVPDRQSEALGQVFEFGEY